MRAIADTLHAAARLRHAVAAIIADDTATRRPQMSRRAFSLADVL